MDCYLNGKAKSLAKIYRKKREFEVIIKELKKEADYYADKVSKLETMYSIATECDKIFKDLQRLYRDFVNITIESVGGDVKDKVIQGLEELMTISQKVASIERRLAKLIKDTLKVQKQSQEERVVNYGYVRR